jgi:glucokinase
LRVHALSRTTKTAPQLVLAGDIGGTKCNLAVFAVASRGRLKPLRRRRFATKDYEHSSFEAMVSDFLAQSGVKKISHAGFASAGVLVEGNFQSTNLPWAVTGVKLRKALRLRRVLLLNDLEATARSLDHLSRHDFLVLNNGIAQPRAPRALIAAGTGLGEAILVWEWNRYRAIASEGGQVDFAPRNDREIELLHFLRKQRKNVCCEDVLSGRGFRSIHQFLAPDARHASFGSEAGGEAEEITRLGLNGECSTCAETLNIWVSIYGAEAGNLALKVLAFGGVYVAGGIALKILPKLRDGRFVHAFCDKANAMEKPLSRIPIRVVMNEDAPLLGAALAATADN